MLQPAQASGLASRGLAAVRSDHQIHGCRSNVLGAGPGLTQLQRDLGADLELLQQQLHQGPVLDDPTDGFALPFGSTRRCLRRFSGFRRNPGCPAPAAARGQVGGTEMALAARALVPEFQAGKGHQIGGELLP